MLNNNSNDEFKIKQNGKMLCDSVREFVVNLVTALNDWISLIQTTCALKIWAHIPKWNRKRQKDYISIVFAF